MPEGRLRHKKAPQEKIPADKLAGLTACLSEDPRPSYQDEPTRIYGMAFGEYNVQFRVEDEVLTVVDISQKVN